MADPWVVVGLRWRPRTSAVSNIVERVLQVQFADRTTGQRTTWEDVPIVEEREKV